jgi:alpha-beta hydrolase superfamily lysophospholipase
LLRLAGTLGKDDKEVRIPLDDPQLFTSDPDWQQFIRDDQLALHSATVSFLRSSCELDRLAAEAPGRIRCPLLMMLAGRDRIIDNKATRRYFERFASTRRKLIEYSQAQHTLEFEPNRDQFVADLTEWLNSVCSTC